MTIVILTGPPAAGKNTVGEALVSLRSSCALVDVDLLRWMLRRPHVAPWLNDEGVRQALLGIRNACGLGKQFAAYGCDVIILDFLWSYSLDAYQAGWPAARPIIIRLMPPESVCLQRNQSRGQWLSDSEVKMLYSQMTQLRGYELSIDNGHLSAADLAARISDFMDKS
jgi:hypothetical protein